MKRGFVFGCVLTTLALLTGCSKSPTPPAPAPAPATPTTGPAATTDPMASAQKFGTAVIEGKVTFEGQRPVAKTLNMSGDAVCASTGAGAIDQSKEIAADGSVPHVFVYIKQGINQTYPVPTEPVLLDQKGCTYVPHVFGIQVGQTLIIRNSDPTPHNIHSLPTKQGGFNLSQPAQGMKSNQTFTREEIMVKIKCDVHGWMSSHAGVLKHPFFAVTDSMGKYSIPKLPAGEYTVEIWHETFQRQTKKVTVKEGETVTLDFVYSKGTKP